jgi:hypothetical protein
MTGEHRGVAPGNVLQACGFEAGHSRESLADGFGGREACVQALARQGWGRISGNF